MAPSKSVSITPFCPPTNPPAPEPFPGWKSIFACLSPFVSPSLAKGSIKVNPALSRFCVVPALCSSVVLIS